MARYTPSGYVYQYNVTDHLGNVRVVVNENRDVEQFTDYFPFGLAVNAENLHINKYLYGNKELQDEVLGSQMLNQLDFGARFYDPLTVRTTTQDPHLENYFSWSPYHFVANNPVNITDPYRDGLV